MHAAVLYCYVVNVCASVTVSGRLNECACLCVHPVASVDTLCVFCVYL